MTRSYIIVLLAVFALFFLQLFGEDVPFGLPLSIGLIVLILVLTVVQFRRKPNH